MVASLLAHREFVRTVFKITQGANTLIESNQKVRDVRVQCNVVVECDAAGVFGADTGGLPRRAAHGEGAPGA